MHVKPEGSELPEVEKMKSAERRRERLPAEGRKEAADGLCGLLAEEEIRELPDEQEKDADEEEAQENQKPRPSIFKPLVVSNFNGGSTRGYGMPYLVNCLRKKPWVECGLEIRLYGVQAQA